MNENDQCQGGEGGRCVPFVETAFSREQVDASVLAEIELGIAHVPCAFLGDLDKPSTR